MTVGYYITAHGYGHAVRSLAVINRLPPEIPVIVRSGIGDDFLDQELRRPAIRAPATFDCGAVQHDSIRVDQRATLARYAAIHADNQRRLDDEVRFLRAHAVQVVVSDSGGFPFRAAQAAGIPSLAVCNFTWVDIYSPYLASYPEYRELIDQMRAEYARATEALALPFSLPMTSFPRRRDIGLVARPFKRIRVELAQHHGIDPRDRWVLVYLGQGPTEFDWSRLHRVNDTRFLVLGREVEPGCGALAAEPRRFGGQNIIASCDAVLAKPGYGTVADCVASGTPLVHARRDDFAESDAIEAGLARWGRALCVDDETFFRGDLAPVLEQVVTREIRAPIEADGIATVVQTIKRLLRGDSAPG